MIHDTMNPPVCYAVLTEYKIDLTLTSLTGFQRLGYRLPHEGYEKWVSINAVPSVGKIYVS
jgi:hypothetical protein